VFTPITNATTSASKAPTNAAAAGRWPAPNMNALTAMASQTKPACTAPRRCCRNRHANHNSAVMSPHRRSSSSVMPP
jgi:hypothetical protein